MDRTGACFSSEGVSLTRTLSNTRNTPTATNGTFDGVAISQKLDRLLQLTSSQADDLQKAKASQEAAEKQIQTLTNKIVTMEEELRAKAKTIVTTRIPRAISVS